MANLIPEPRPLQKQTQASLITSQQGFYGSPKREKSNSLAEAQVAHKREKSNDPQAL